jgi:hypothetical protein
MQKFLALIDEQGNGVTAQVDQISYVRRIDNFLAVKFIGNREEVKLSKGSEKSEEFRHVLAILADRFNACAIDTPIAVPIASNSNPEVVEQKNSECVKASVE